MSITSTFAKLAGLVFAMGLFGMGPCTDLFDEFKAKWDSQKRLREEEEAANVTPPGEEPPKKVQPNSNHFFDGTTTASTLQKHPTSQLSQEAAHDYVTHPFLPVTRTISTGNRPVPMATTTTTIVQSENIPPSEIPWLSFMMHKPSQATTKQPEIGKL